MSSQVSVLMYRNVISGVMAIYERITKTKNDVPLVPYPANDNGTLYLKEDDGKIYQNQYQIGWTTNKEQGNRSFFCSIMEDILSLLI